MAKKKDTTEVSEDQVKKSRIEEVVELYRSKSKDAGEIILVNSEDFKKDIPIIPSGILSLDIALGIGGFPQGRIIELFGLESGGKTSVCLQAISEAQRLGGIGAFIDAEHALDLPYAGKLGVNCNNLIISKPDCGEEALSTVEHLAEVLGPGDIIVIDSVAALVPRSEFEGEMGQQFMGLHARLMSQACRKLTSIISNSGVTVIFINQIRMKIGLMFGNPETTTGGGALKFFSTIRLDVRASTAIKKGEEKVGSEVKIKIAKNKVANPFKECRVELIYGQGIPKANDILEHAIQQNLVVKSGAHYSLANGEKIGQGKDNTIEFLKNSPNVLENLEKQLRKIYFGK